MCYTEVCFDRKLLGLWRPFWQHKISEESASLHTNEHSVCSTLPTEPFCTGARKHGMLALKTHARTEADLYGSQSDVLGYHDTF